MSDEATNDQAANHGDLFRANAAAVVEIGRTLTDVQLASVVPATPEWTALDLFAHLAGGSTDAAEGRFEGAGTPAFTARQVQERSGRSIDDLLDELGTNVDAVAESIDPSGPNLAWDFSIHHADLVEAFAQPRPDESLWRPLLEAMRGKIGSTLSGVDDYEQFRSVFSRRSSRQLAELSDAPTAELDALGVFGPRDDDQPRPAA